MCITLTKQIFLLIKIDEESRKIFSTNSAEVDNARGKVLNERLYSLKRDTVSVYDNCESTVPVPILRRFHWCCVCAGGRESACVRREEGRTSRRKLRYIALNQSRLNLMYFD
jgi:hypothetical protein